MQEKEKIGNGKEMCQNMILFLGMHMSIFIHIHHFFPHISTTYHRFHYGFKGSNCTLCQLSAVQNAMLSRQQFTPKLDKTPPKYLAFDLNKTPQIFTFSPPKIAATLMKGYTTADLKRSPWQGVKVLVTDQMELLWWILSLTLLSQVVLQ